MEISNPLQIEPIDSHFSYNIPQVEFVMIHATIDRLIELYQSNKIIITPTQIRTLRNIRRKPTYLTISHKSSLVSILNVIILRNRGKRKGDLYNAMAFKSQAIIPKRKKSPR
ncbi:MAG: hypothetical protein HS129_04935 [Leptospiraceae bacterium]|nr:hypothetical protein [Leptospiraceae bacterium]NUM42902.1 hypothetical protein [Leptospiraceae bacterium]